jgi:hypothetical protein
VQSLKKALDKGAIGEDNDTLPGSLPVFGTNLPGRFYFHFFPALNNEIFPGNLLTLQSATCASPNWGLSSGSCSATATVIANGTIAVNTLTNAINQNNLQATLASTTPDWQDLGYVIHLLEDLTSPAHVRNDGHPCLGGFLVCDNYERGNNGLDPTPPAASQSLLGAPDPFTLSGPSDLFNWLKTFVQANFYSSRTVFVGPGPRNIDEDASYVYGCCLGFGILDDPACFQQGSQGGNVRKIAAKGAQFQIAQEQLASGSLTASQSSQTFFVDTMIAQEQYRELGPITVQYVAALIKWYAPALQANVSGTGHGMVTSGSGSLNCASANTPCSALFAQTMTGPPLVTLNEQPSSDSVFSGWSDDCSNSGTATQAPVQLTSDKSCTANFTLKPQLTVTVSGSGTGSVVSSPAGINCGTTCLAPFLPNSQVTLTAIPSSGATFSGWSGACSGTSTSVTITMSSDKTCTASFQGVPAYVGTWVGTAMGLPPLQGSYTVPATFVLFAGGYGSARWGPFPNGYVVSAGISVSSYSNGVLMLSDSTGCDLYTFNVSGASMSGTMATLLSCGNAGGIPQIQFNMTKQ